jgi:hypothetical protein
MTQVHGQHGARQRLAEEMREYLALSLYLFVCIGAVFLYRAALLEEHGIGGLELGAAAVKALVLAKFAMLGRMAGLGEARTASALVPALLRASLGMMAALVLLTAVEEIVVGLLHHRGPDGALAELVDGRWAEVAASMLLLWLILLPYLAYRRLHQVLDAEAGRRFLRGG